jgi:sugar transferase (PEP-CTERM system associated)
MVRVFGHYLPIRAILFAAFELAAFVALFNIFKIATLYMALGHTVPLYGEQVMLPVFVALVFATASACGLYNKEMFADTDRLVSRLVIAAVLSYFMMAVTVSLVAFGVDTATSAPNLKYYYAVALAAAIGSFVTSLLFRLNFFAHNFNGTVLERRVLVVGVDERASKIERLNGHSRSPYTTVGFVPFGQEVKCSSLSYTKVISGRIMENPGELSRLAGARNVDEIVVASRERRGLPLESLMECKLAGVTVTDFPSFWERQTGQIDLEEMTPSWLIFSNGFRTTWQGEVVKRCFDIIVSLIVLILTLPVTCVTAILIKLESPGPMFYRQERVGRSGRTFDVLKFRSMCVDAEKDGIARWAQNSDPRVTRVGAFIRRTRIDEIPQVINVLIGQMSFVGPRPERPVFVNSLAQKIPYYDVRHRVKPGITGWAQINYPYGASDEDAKAKLAFDLYYVKNWNLFLDAVILFQTARVVLWREGAR